MNKGFIKDYRKELDSEIWLMPPLYHRVWQWIKYTVNHTQKELPNSDGSTTIVKVGQCPTSYRQIASGVGYFENNIWKMPGTKTIKNILDWLEMKSMILIEKNGKGTLITVVQWDVYQDNSVQKKQQKNPKTGKQQRNTLETLEGNAKETLESVVYGEVEGVNSRQEKQQRNTLETLEGNAKGILLKNDKNNKNIYKEKYIKRKTSIDLSFDDVAPEILDDLKNFVEFREEIKAPMTQRALNIINNILKKEGSDFYKQKKMIENSIVNGWKSVYPLDEKKNNSKNNNPDKTGNKANYSERTYDQEFFDSWLTGGEK